LHICIEKQAFFCTITLINGFIPLQVLEFEIETDDVIWVGEVDIGEASIAVGLN